MSREIEELIASIVREDDINDRQQLSVTLENFIQANKDFLNSIQIDNNETIRDLREKNGKLIDTLYKVTKA